jgi:hypothetical protein
MLSFLCPDEDALMVGVDTEVRVATVVDEAAGEPGAAETAGAADVVVVVVVVVEAMTSVGGAALCWPFLPLVALRCPLELGTGGGRGAGSGLLAAISVP